MKGTTLCILAGLLLCLLVYAVHLHGRPGPRPIPDAPRRIVSFSPAITETLYALGLGENVAGVTNFCLWPPDAAKKTKIGGFQEVNPEAVARLGADLVILPVEMSYARQRIEDLGIPVMLFDSTSLDGFLRDVEKLGQLAGAREEAETLVSSFRKAVNEKKDSARPKALFVIMTPDECAAPLTDVTIIGNAGFYNELLEAAGAQNAYAGKIPYPRLSLEAVLALRPDILIIGAPNLPDASAPGKKWLQTGLMRDKTRLLILNEPGDTIPGPRALGTLKKITQAVNEAKTRGTGK